MKVRTDVRRSDAGEKQVYFTTGRAGGKGAERYTGAVLYVYHHVGERPNVIVLGPSDMYSAAQARNGAACLLAAAEWIEANVRNVIRKATKPQRAKKGGR